MNEPINFEKLILDFVASDGYQPMKLRGIAKGLKLLDDEKNLKRAVKRLIKQDRLAYGPKHLVMLSKSRPMATVKTAAKSKSGTDSTKTSNATIRTSERSNEIIGTFRRAAAGFGFVTPQASTATDRSEDIFIPKQKTLDAADQDLVRIRLSRGHQDSKPDPRGASGRIVLVLERHTNRFVGTYFERGKDGIVVVDGGLFETGILVGDAGAKNCRVDDKVVIEMVHFPSSQQEGEGVIVEVLGERGKPGVDTLSIIRQFGLPEDFSEKVLEDARQQAAAFNDETIPDNRTDFTTKTVITIDPQTARDFDDAISLERLENGHWQLGVHIADVSHFVPYHSELDNEAFYRGTSVYLPDRVIPMLPEIISNNLASLQPDRVRYCLTALIEMTDTGIPIATELFRGAIKSVHRFNYEEIDQYLANDEPWRQKLTPGVFQLVRDMHTLAMKIRKRRMDGGAINLVLPEIKIDLDDDGKVCGAHTVENTESHQVIEEFMLAANIAVAQRLVDEKLFLMRRVHPYPTDAKLADLNNFVKGLGIDAENLQNRYEMKRVIEQSEGMPEQHAIHYAVLRSMQKAIYSPEEIGHYALNADTYCHFTSPIRRYPDLIIHRMVGDLIDGKKPESNFDRLTSLGKHCSELEKRAAEAERELTKLKLLNFMSDKVGQTLHAIITGVEAFGIFAQGVEIPAEGLLPVANLPEDSYQYDRASRMLTGFKQDNQFRLGDQIEVKVAMVDPDRRMLEFELVGVKPSPRNAIQRSQHVSRPASQRHSEKTVREKSPREHAIRGKPTREKPARDETARHEKKPSRDDTARQEKLGGKRVAGKNEPAAQEKRPAEKPDGWAFERASGPQAGQRKKRRISERDAIDKKRTGKPGKSPGNQSKSENSKLGKPKSSKRITSKTVSPKPKSANPKSSQPRASKPRSSHPPKKSE